MFLIKKLIILVAILLVAVFGVSFVSRSFDMGTGGSYSDDGHTGIGLPTEGKVYLHSYSPLEENIYNTSLDKEGVFTCTGRFITFNKLGYTLEGKESVIMQFGQSSGDGLSLFDYNYFKIEFTIKTFGSDTLPCKFSLFGRNSNNSSENLSISTSFIKVDLENDGVNPFIETFNGEKIYGDEFNVVYLVEVDKENYNKSRVQVFVNDILYEDSVYYDGLFTNKDVDRICGVSVNNFSPMYESENPDRVEFPFLCVTVYD